VRVNQLEDNTLAVYACETSQEDLTEMTCDRMNSGSPALNGSVVLYDEGRFAYERVFALVVEAEPSLVRFYDLGGKVIPNVYY
jgi:hypothetical protein